MYNKDKNYGGFHMEIIKNIDGSVCNIELQGRLDTTTAPQLEAVLKSSLNGIGELVFDFSKLEYISSAGLRVLLSAQKVMNAQGKMNIKNVSAEIMEVFEITGFTDILTIA